MAEDKKLVEAITSMKEDFAQWYTDVCKKAELMSYSSVKGCMIFKPAGYAIWENIKNEMDRSCLLYTSQARLNWNIMTILLSRHI